MNVRTDAKTITDNDLGEFALSAPEMYGTDPRRVVSLGGQRVAMIWGCDRKGYDVLWTIRAPSLGHRSTIPAALDLLRQAIGNTSHVMGPCANARVHNAHSLVATDEAGPGRLCPGKVPTTAAEASRGMRRVIGSPMGYAIRSRLIDGVCASWVDVVSGRCAQVVINAALTSGLVREARYAVHGGYVVVYWKTA